MNRHSAITRLASPDNRHGAAGSHSMERGAAIVIAACWLVAICGTCGCGAREPVPQAASSETPASHQPRPAVPGQNASPPLPEAALPDRSGSEPPHDSHGSLRSATAGMLLPEDLAAGLDWVDVPSAAPLAAENDEETVGPTGSASNSGGILRRAIADSWLLDHFATYRRDGPDPRLGEIQTALAIAQRERAAGQIEVPVDTNRDGRANVWVYFAGDRPAYLEADRFGTGCRDLRIALATAAATERVGWETSPPVPLPRDVPDTSLEEFFDWIARCADSQSASTPLARLAGRCYPELDSALPRLAVQDRAGQELAERLARFAAEAHRLLPRLQQHHQLHNYNRELARPWGHEEKHEGFDRSGNQADRAPVLVGFAPSGVVRIQFYAEDWRDPLGLLASVEFAEGAVSSVHHGGRWYHRLAGFWVRPAEKLRPLVAERYLAPGYRRWSAGDWYGAVSLWRRGTELAAMLGDLPVDDNGVPRSKLTRQVQGIELQHAAREWRFEADDLPAAALLTVGAHLAWMRDDDLLDGLRGLAEHAVAQRDYHEALDRYRLLLRFTVKLDKAVARVNALDAMSELYRHLGYSDLALDCLHESLEIESSLAYAQDIVKNVRLLSGDAGSPETLRKSMEMRSHAMALNRGCKLAMIAALLGDLGDRDRAESYLAESRRLIQAAGAAYCEADLLNLQAAWDIADSRWELAQQRLQRALQIVAAAAQTQREHDRGARLLETGKAMHPFLVPGTRDYLIVGMSSQTGPGSFLALSGSLMAELMLQRALQAKSTDADAWLAAALRWQRQSLRWYDAADDAAGQLVARLHLARIMTHQGDPAALELSRQVVAEAREVRAFDTLWQSLALEGRIHTRTGNWAEAVTAYERAANEIETVRAGLRSESVRQGFFRSKLDVYEQLALLYYRQREHTADGEHLAGDLRVWQCMERAKARTLLDIVGGQSLPVRGAAADEALRDYPLLIARLHGRGASQLRGEAASQDAEDRLLDRLLSHPDLQELASLAVVQPVELPAIQRALADGQWLLEYFQTEDDLLVAVVSRDRLRVHRLDGLGRERMLRDVERYRRVLERLDPAYQGLASQLYRDLLQPVLQQEKDVRQLCIVPSGALHYIPFEAFLTPSGEFVGETHLVSYAPSASALVYALNRHRLPREVDEGLTLVVSEPVAPPEFGPLPGALLEGERIGALARGPKIFLQGREATETAVAAALQTARYVHFAGHTDLSPHAPMRAALLCTQDVDNDGRLEVREIFGFDLDACRLAVLSACETRLGRWSRGDEIVGLERALLRAGVPTVVASLWKVDDAATSLLMEAFYANLWGNNLSPAEALARARRVLIRSPDVLEKRRQELAAELARRATRGPASTVPYAFSTVAAGPTAPGETVTHPGYWAAFVLSGDWR